MEYDVITADTREEFVERVNERLREGWSLYGELHPAAMVHAPGRYGDMPALEWHFFQAVTRRLPARPHEHREG